MSSPSPPAPPPAPPRVRRDRAALRRTGLRRRPMMPPSTNVAAGRREHRGDARDGARADRVAVHIDRLSRAAAQRRGKALGEATASPGRDDRQDDVGRRDRRIVHRAHPRCRARAADAPAAPGKRRRDLDPARGQAGGDGAAHGARRDHGDDRRQRGWRHGGLLLSASRRPRWARGTPRHEAPVRSGEQQSGCARSPRPCRTAPPAAVP